MTEAHAPRDLPWFAVEYAAGLLDELRAPAEVRRPALDARHPDLDWAASGAMALTGFPDGPPLLAPAPLASAACAAVAALAAVATSEGLPGHERLREIDGGALLGERAALSGFSRQGRSSPGGSCHLLRSRDGWIAVNLARADDISLLPAWLGAGDVSDVLAFVNRRARTRDSAELVAAARELGLPVAEAARPLAHPPSWYRIDVQSAPRRTPRSKRPLVVDLSALWAGPLATHLLSLAGARVIKVESTRRPDGARRGPRAFYDLLNAGKESVALDFTANDARRTLAAILERADIVVEASRPRALAQLGIDAVSLVRSRPGMVWVGITGYGRREPECNRVAFGDDAGAAAGLAMAMCRDGRGDARLKDGPVFCGDAIADPLTGMHAALAALCAWQQGGGLLLDVNLHDVTAHVLGAGRVYCEGRGFSPLTRSYVAAEDDGRWEVVSATGTQPVLAPRAREVFQRAEELGAHTRLVLEELDTPC